MQAPSSNSKHIWLIVERNNNDKYVFYFPKLQIIVHKMVLHFLDSDLNFKIYSSFTRSHLFLWYRKKAREQIIYHLLATGCSNTGINAGDPKV